MSEFGLFIATFVAAYLGFVLIALSQARHWRKAGGTDVLASIQVILMRVFGGILLALSLCFALLRDNVDFGTVLWIIVLSLAAIAVVLTLAWRPYYLRPVTLLADRKPTNLK